MNTLRPSEAVQAGRTEHWQDLRDQAVEEYKETADGARIWRPIDYYAFRRPRLRRLGHFIEKAGGIVEESLAADAALAQQALRLTVIEFDPATTRPQSREVAQFAI